MMMALTWMLMMFAEVVRVAVDEGEEEDAAVLVRMLMAVVVVKEKRAQENVQENIKAGAGRCPRPRTCIGS